jgi:hypothetical protein
MSAICGESRSTCGASLALRGFWPWGILRYTEFFLNV